MKTKQIKPVKGWAIVNQGEFKITGYFEDCESCGNKSDGYSIHTHKKDAEYYISESRGDNIIPVLITPIQDKPKSLLGTSKMIIRNGKPVITKK